MFICHRCKQPSAPRIAPIIAATTVPVEYVDREDRVIGHGSKIVAELKFCRTCAGLKPVVPENRDVLDIYKRGASTRHIHVMSCKGFKTKKDADGHKTEIPCASCEEAIRFFAGIPLHLLSDVLAERPSTRGSRLSAVVHVH